jgi:hypothetical protein
LDKKKKNTPDRFDPFTDRLSRDIRNNLTEAFVISLKQKDSRHYKNLSRQWLAKGLGLIYNEYIQMIEYFQLNIFKDRLRRVNFSDWKG